MCFSAGASFGAGAILLGMGAACMYKAESTPQRVLAGIPLMFSIQQFDEGIVWLSLSDSNYLQWQQPAIRFFLFFAQVIWPVFVPLAMLLFEKDPVRKKLLRISLALGVSLGAYLLYCLFTYPVSAVVAGHHIRYDFTYPYTHGWYSGLLYFIPTVVSPLISGNRKLQLIGVVLLVSYLISKMFYGEYLISVWCYFAAFLSAVIYWVIVSGKEERVKQIV
ncbi:hypothetical protein MRBLMN1_005702 [Chitinophaga ginsengisegetis]|uniref:DUF6629 family protein n=1 Tax=Chitinophaga ginsengisegetis TaxID=393003 RepID=UPI00342464C1